MWNIRFVIYQSTVDLMHFARLSAGSSYAAFLDG